MTGKGRVPSRQSVVPVACLLLIEGRMYLHRGEDLAATASARRSNLTSAMRQQLSHHTLLDERKSTQHHL